MKIVYLIHQFYPKWITGTEKLLLNLSTTLQKQGHKVKVITYSRDIISNAIDLYNSKKEGNIMFEEYIYQGIPVLSFGYQVQPDDIHFAVTNKDLSKFTLNILSKERPDIIHVTHSMRTAEFIRTASSLKIPYIFTLTDFWLICPKTILVDSANNLCYGPKDGEACKKKCPELPKNMTSERLQLVKELLINANAVFAPTRIMKELFEGEIKELKLKTINFGLAPYSHTLFKDKQYKRGDTIKLFYGGTWQIHKGVHILLDAFRKIKSDRVTLDIYGYGYDEKYNALIKKSAQKDPRIKVKGIFSETEMGTIFSDVDVSVMPSIWWENAPYMMTEALLRCVPVISSDIGGLTENVKDNFNGFTFKVGDSEHLKNIIERIIDNPPILNELRNNLKEHLFPTIEQEAFSYERAYKSIVKGNNY